MTRRLGRAHASSSTATRPTAVASNTIAAARAGPGSLRAPRSSTGAGVPIGPGSFALRARSRPGPVPIGPGSLRAPRSSPGAGCRLAPALFALRAHRPGPVPDGPRLSSRSALIDRGRAGVGLSSRSALIDRGRVARRRPERSSASAARRRRTAVTSSARSARRWVTRKQKSSAEPVTRWAASGGPQDQVSAAGCAQLDQERLGRRGQAVDRRTRNRGCAPRGARSIATGAVGGRLTPRASATSSAVRPGLHQPRGGHRRRAHRRAEPWQLAARRGPRASASCSRLRVWPPVGEQLGGRIWSPSSSAAVVDEAGRGRQLRPPARRRRPTSSVTAVSATRSVHNRCPIWCAMVQPGAGVGSAQRSPAAAPPSRPSSSLSARRSATIGPGPAIIAAERRSQLSSRPPTHFSDYSRAGHGGRRHGPRLSSRKRSSPAAA